MKKILDKHIFQSEYARQSFRIVIPFGHSIDDTKKLDYWANVARKFNPHDLLELVAEDGSFYAEAIVIDKGPLWAKIFVKGAWALHDSVSLSDDAVDGDASVKPAAPVIDESMYEVKWGGPSAKYRIHHKETNDLLAPESFPSKEDALAYLVKLKSRVSS